jgi:drug/metabolite transporter (DMT)-like permease
VPPTAARASPAAAALRANRRGIQYMVAAMACFIVNDALVKYASQTMPAAQLIFLRGVIASVMVLAVAHGLGATARFAEVVRGWVAARAAVDAVATVLYLVSLFHLPLGNVTAINMASPLLIAALAVPLLGERVDARRWLAIGIGFTGVLLVIQPSAAGFNAYSLVALAATVLHAGRDLLTRRIPASVPVILVTLSTALAVTVLAGGLSLIEGWRPFTAAELALLALAAAFLAAAYHLVIRATRSGELSVIVPFRYTGLLWALLLGYVVWGDVPNLPAWAGIALLIGAGLYSLHRERTVPL